MSRLCSLFFILTFHPHILLIRQIALDLANNRYLRPTKFQAIHNDYPARLKPDE